MIKVAEHTSKLIHKYSVQFIIIICLNTRTCGQPLINHKVHLYTSTIKHKQIRIISVFDWISFLNKIRSLLEHKKRYPIRKRNPASVLKLFIHQIKGRLTVRLLMFNVIEFSLLLYKRNSTNLNNELRILWGETWRNKHETKCMLCVETVS